VNKKIYIALIFAAYSYGCKPKQTNNKPHDFKNSDWGMSIEAVSNAETNSKSIAHTDDMLVYAGTLDGMKAQVSYGFDENKRLFSASYTIVEPFASSNTYILKYQSLKSDLIKMYGKPEKDETNWIDPLYKDHLNNYGMAVSKGELNYLATWKLKNKSLIIQLKGEDFKSDLTISYFSPASMAKYKEKPAEGL
jgi:hypothetical protein